MKKSLLAESVEIKWPKSKAGRRRGYVYGQLIVKHKELTLRSQTQGKICLCFGFFKNCVR